MPASASGLFYEANINRELVDLALRVYSESPCLYHLQRLERETQEWIAILVEWRGTVEGQYARLLDLALVMLRETGEKLRQQSGTGARRGSGASHALPAKPPWTEQTETRC